LSQRLKLYKLSAGRQAIGVRGNIRPDSC